MVIQLPQGAGCLSDVAQAMQEAAIAHSVDLKIDHDALLEGYGCLWMLVRYQIALSRLPVGPLTVETFLRSPSSVFSLRDFTLFDEKGECGRAVQTWVVVSTEERSMRPISSIPQLLAGPVPQPERTSRPRRIRLPKELPFLGNWTVAENEIDDNEHLNNVAYVRHAEALAGGGYTSLDVCFERECFAGERLQFFGADTEEGFVVKLCKESGELSFCALFGKES